MPGGFKRCWEAELAEPFSFTKGCKVLKVPCRTKHVADMPAGTEWLFDIEKDPQETTPILDEEVKIRLKAALREILKENDAPQEVYECYGLTRP